MNADRLDQLLARIRAGEDGAYAQFLTKCAERLRADLRRQVPSEDVLESVVRQCLIAVHRKRHTLPLDRPVAPWLSAIGHYQLTEHSPVQGQKPARQLQAERQSGMARLVDLGDDAADGSGGRSAAILAALMRRVRRTVPRRPIGADRAGA